jgi:F0F1-type ATP synthase assembly protein I
LILSKVAMPESCPTLARGANERSRANLRKGTALKYLAIMTPIEAGLSLIHPIVMVISLVLAFYTLYLGLKARQMRSAKGKTKKQLIEQRYGIKHYQLSSILLSIFVIGPILGMAMTYIIRGKLFLDFHLIVGLAIAALISISASLVPFMLKENKLARNIHLVINIIVLGLFGWQSITGMQILQHYVAEMISEYF